jgi:hypothetical protein
MPLLFLIVASLLVFLAVMILVAVAAASERAQLRRIQFDPLAEPFALHLSQAFDPEMAMIWAAQIDALLLIASGGSEGVDYDSVYRAYQRAAGIFPELYEGCGFAQWLFFLQSSELVVLTGSRVKITACGREFLNCCLPASSVA